LKFGNTCNISGIVTDLEFCGHMCCRYWEEVLHS
jgi:hypothetical protein